MSMVKLIRSSDFDETIGVGMEFVDRDRAFGKKASTVFGMDYDSMKPDDRHVGIHVVALGDSEHYQFNRNGDGFPKEACEKYHDTFVKHGHVFRHHMNKEAEKSIGDVVASAYNEPMGRIELFIHADKDKAAPELARLEKEGEIPFSMACTVDHDRCSICGAMRKHAGDAFECDHVANHLGELFEDGRQVGTYNDEPKFFDISFVGRPADRIAWNLKVATSLPLDSVKLAEHEGIVPPDDLACDTESSLRKLGYARDVAGLQRRYCSLRPMEKSASAEDRFLDAVSFVGLSSLPDEAVSRLRELPEKVAFEVLGRNGVIMDVPTFFKYATGDDYRTVVEPYMRKVAEAVPFVIESRVSSGRASTLCNRTEFDASCSGLGTREDQLVSGFSCTDDVGGLAVKSAGFSRRRRPAVDISGGMVFNGGVVEKLAETYAAYQLSAIDAVLSYMGRDKFPTEAVVASSNLAGHPPARM